MSAFLIVESIIPLFCFVLVLITFPIYTITVIILIRGYFQRGDNHSFYRLCMIGGIVDILALIDNYLLGILPARGYFLLFYQSTTRIGGMYLAISWGVRYSQNITALLLAVNRLTALMRPMNFQSMWSDRVCLVTHFIQIVPGIIVGAVLLSTNFYYETSGLGGIYTMFGDEDFKRVYYTVSGTIGSLFALSMIVIYCVVWVLFRRLHAVISSVKKQELQRQENRLLYISLCICIMEMLCFLFTVITFLIKFDPSGIVEIKPVRFFYLFYNANVDIYSCAPPFLLIIFSTPFRRRFVQFTRLSRLTRCSHSVSSTSSLRISTLSMSSTAR